MQLIDCQLSSQLFDFTREDWLAKGAGYKIQYEKANIKIQNILNFKPQIFDK